MFCICSTVWVSPPIFRLVLGTLCSLSGFSMVPTIKESSVIPLDLNDSLVGFPFLQTCPPCNATSALSPSHSSRKDEHSPKEAFELSSQFP
ncbi:hypothetical protein XENOCAPTIV_004759 [Xenoophorus captivus]|uniref:Secreted protein n=1 Tax=Xenoophorus captivus TaxID=1517983 RepID=A0ABV0RNS6_9TELE